MKELAMGWERVAKCAVCGRIKGQGNKWLLVHAHVNPDLVNTYFTVYHWSAPLAEGTQFMFICGEECLHNRLQEFLDLRGRISSLEPGGPECTITKAEPEPEYESH